MKHLLVLIWFILVASTAFAQTNKYTSPAFINYFPQKVMADYLRPPYANVVHVYYPTIKCDQTNLFWLIFRYLDETKNYDLIESTDLVTWSVVKTSTNGTLMVYRKNENEIKVISDKMVAMQIQVPVTKEDKMRVWKLVEKE